MEPDVATSGSIRGKDNHADPGSNVFSADHDVAVPHCRGGSQKSAARPDGRPEGVILVKGAESASSDSTTPLPKDGSVADGRYQNG
jgi:hypothetical protein